MKKAFYSVAFALIITSFIPACLFAQSVSVKQVKLTNFDLQSSSQVNASGEELSGSNYQYKGYWFPVKVPSTVLTGLVANHIYPDPYQGLNNMLIPDASDQFNKEYNLEQYSYLPNEPNPWKKPYWYRTTFKVPAGDKGRHFQLIFKGINYRAAVWVNGKQIADSTQMAGMFAEYNLDVTNAIITGGENALAVKIYPLDYAGYPAKEQLQALGPFFENGGPSGDIGKNVTMLCSVGWDWIPPVRDRNMGIWQPVYLRTTGAVTIGRPKLVTELPNLPDTSVARLSLNLSLLNHSSALQKGKLTISIKPENFAGLPVQFTQDETVAANGVSIVDLNADKISQLLIHQPHLWWPNGYGKANLYRIRLQFADGNGIADDTSFVFGIRTASSTATNVRGFVRRDFYVNGKKVHLNGGAWVPDMMVNRDSARYDYEMHLCRNANVNLVRIWGGGVTPPDAFWNAADKYGEMVWSDFWVTGDTQGEFKGSPDWPLEGNVFIKNVVSTIYRIRNHPSLLVWTGGNEGHARKELYDAMRDNIIALDGTRPFIPSSSGYAKLPAGWKGSYPDDMPSGVYSGGPYQWEDPKVYYKKADFGGDWVFKDETGIPSQPPYTTLAKTIPDLVWDTKLPYPLNNSWGYHDACTGAAQYDKYYNEMVKRYGQPSTLVNFSDKMQLMNWVGYQGIFEAAGHKLNETGGVMLWKLNSALPSVVWQIYDWYLEPNAGYYAMQNAVEPLHIQFNQDDSTAAVINRLHHATGLLTAKADIYDINSRLVKTFTVNHIGLAEAGTQEVIPLKGILKTAKGVSFVVLNLTNAAGKTVSHNVYWMAPGDDLTGFNSLQPAQVQVKVIKAEKGTGESKWTLQFTNNTDKIAFFVRPQLMENGEEVMPSYWTGSYFTLAPNESITVSVSAPLAKLGKTQPTVLLEGWNLPKQVISLTVK
ncbi:glycoside hydrolase family 2 protein [Mucilaginibacter gotjawali]|uniref:Beta-galactosidase/beta-glucuronidase n=2 Tax=Mucilaginibacter gotjawali TaxID=1550579 RepID=A0A839SF56_9SPHI|nr:sugar-binding domain-containing protein [Mucilaginibacter gotjawali]MBB3056198.1 beta-galactosidase/beta-glucuronidase [Mucilaginibacter gotjawali]BAU53460.1 Exo-beta-D-glucosaminidase precursor [Mucilaginibacter gotjawali]